MRRLTSFVTSGAALAALVLTAAEAQPCGGAFGYEYTISPSQNIVVSYRNGIETYVFNPHFCGQASSFGLILPIPSVLSANPTLGGSQLYTDLAAVAAPTIETREACLGEEVPGGGRSNGTGGAASDGGGTTVIQTGTVGVFDYALLQADDTASFTDWLDANGFPYEASAEAAFDHYVRNDWYFVAFKVSADAETEGSGGTGGVPNSTLCGDFGPISLAFAVEQNPVVPARIAAVSSSSLTWTVYTLADRQLRVRDQSSELRFSGAITQEALGTRATIAALAEAGTRLTELRVAIDAPDNDLILEADPAEEDYRRVEIQYVYVNCTAGAGNTGAAGAAGAGSAGETGGAPLPTGGQSSIPATGGKSSEDPENAAGTSSAFVPPADAGPSTGGKTASPAGGSTHTGGTQATGGATGGAPAATTGGAVDAGTVDAGAHPTMPFSNDEGDCSCRVGRARGNHALQGLLAAAVACMLAGGRRRQRRRS